MKTDGPTAFLRKNEWLVIAIVLFIVWKFILIATMWHDRTLPPEPDDSLYYSGHIYASLRCPYATCDQPFIALDRQSGYDYLTYRVSFGLLGRVLGLSAAQIYHASFYIGTVLLAIVLAALLPKLVQDRRAVPFTLLILALFHGGGSYHGFFWVVPSFFSLLLFFIILTLVMNGHSRRQRWTLLAATALFVHVHPISLFALAILPLYAAINFVLNKKLNRVLLRNVLFTLIIALLARLPVYMYLQQVSSVNSSTSAVSTSDTATVSRLAAAPYLQEIKEQVATSDFTHLRTDYVDWLFPHWLAVPPFIFFLHLLLRYRQYHVLSLFLASLIFTLTSMALHPAGVRSLLFLWPATYLFYGLGFWCSFRYIRERFPNGPTRVVLRTTLGVMLTLFVIANVVYAFLMSDLANRNDNLSLPEEYTEYLLANTVPGDPIFPHSTMIQAHLLNTELTLHEHGDALNQAKYIVTFTPEQPPSTPAPIDYFFATLTTLFRGPNERLFPKVITQSPQQAAAAKAASPGEQPGLILEKRFGDVSIYRNANF